MKPPPYRTFPNISGDKVSLRQVFTSDIPYLIDISFYDAIQATNLQQAIEIQDKINKDYISGNSIHWGIIDNLTNKVVGTCGYYRGFEKGEGELGCVLLSQFKGQGFMTSAIHLAIDFGINPMELKRIWALTSQQNKKAIQLLERLNFQKTGFKDEDQIEYELLQTKIL